MEATEKLEELVVDLEALKENHCGVQANPVPVGFQENHRL